MKKAQAALEFLITYGWAILVVITAIGALAYFGILNPSNFLPEQCLGPAGMDCIGKATVVSGPAGTGYVEFVLKNNIGSSALFKDLSNTTGYYPINISGSSCTSATNSTGIVGHYLASTATNGATPGVVSDLIAPYLSVQNGDFVKIRVFCGNNIATGRFKGVYTIRYTASSTGIDQAFTVTVNSKVR